MTMTIPTDSAEKVVADHERIWLEPLAPQYGHDGRLWCQNKVWPQYEGEPEPTEYVRADLYAAAEARVTALEAEKAGAIKLADGYGIVLMMIAAGCSDPQRFAKRMLTEYEAEANALKREQSDA